jgi:hypothetical protein
MHWSLMDRCKTFGGTCSYHLQGSTVMYLHSEDSMYGVTSVPLILHGEAGSNYTKTNYIKSIPVTARSKALACWDCGFEFLRGHGCLSLVSVVCCQVDDSASNWSFVQRSHNECGVSKKCVIAKPRTMRRPRTPRGCRAIGKKNYIIYCYISVY